MTTIAYKDGVLAADSGLCGGGCMVGTVDKIARNSCGDLAGAAGDAAYHAQFIAWFLKAEEGDPPVAVESEDSFDRGIIFRRTGQIEVFEPRGRFPISAPYYAIGSGRAEALGALHAGASPEQAVLAAIEHDPHSKGPVLVLRACE